MAQKVALRIRRKSKAPRKEKPRIGPPPLPPPKLQDDPSAGLDGALIEEDLEPGGANTWQVFGVERSDDYKFGATVDQLQPGLVVRGN